MYHNGIYKYVSALCSIMENSVFIYYDTIFVVLQVQKNLSSLSSFICNLWYRRNFCGCVVQPNHAIKNRFIISIYFFWYSFFIVFFVWFFSVFNRYLAKKLFRYDNEGSTAHKSLTAVTTFALKVTKWIFNLSVNIRHKYWQLSRNGLCEDRWVDCTYTFARDESIYCKLFHHVIYQLWRAKRVWGIVLKSFDTLFEIANIIRSLSAFRVFLSGIGTSTVNAIVKVIFHPMLAYSFIGLILLLMAMIM